MKANSMNKFIAALERVIQPVAQNCNRSGLPSCWDEEGSFPPALLAGRRLLPPIPQPGDTMSQNESTESEDAPETPDRYCLDTRDQVVSTAPIQLLEKNPAANG